MMLTAKQVAERMGVTEKTVRKWHADGKLKGVRLGYRTLRFRLAEVEKMLERCE